MLIIVINKQKVLLISERKYRPVPFILHRMLYVKEVQYFDETT